jgi:hypothetical protein
VKVAVVPFAVIQRHKNQSLDAHEYLGNLHAREKAERETRAARAKIANAIAALREADEIEARQKAEGIRVISA